MVWLRLRRWVVRPVIWLFAVAAFLVLALRAFLASDFVAEQAARIAEREIGRIVGRPIEIGALEFELLPATVVVHDLLIPSDARQDAPLLTVRRLAVELDTDAIRRNLIDLQSVEISGVRAHIALREDGSDNLPRFPARDPEERDKGRFSVRIGGLYIDDGVLDLGDRRVPLDVRAQAILVRLVGLGSTDLQGSVTAQEVETVFAGATPWPATVSGRIRLENDRIEILQARLASAELNARVSGSIGWIGGTHGDLLAVVRSSARWLDERGFLHGEIGGELNFDGRLRFARKEFRLEGNLASPALGLLGLEIDDFGGRVSGNLDRLDLEIESGSYRGAVLGGHFTADLAATEPVGDLVLQVEGAPLRDLLRDLDLPEFGIRTSAHGELNYRFPFARAGAGEGSAAFELAGDPRAAGGGVAADGVLGLEIGRERLRIVELALHSGAQVIAGRGEFSLSGGGGAGDSGGRFDAEIESADLAELAAIQTFIATEPPPLWLPTSGTGAVGVHVDLIQDRVVAVLELDLAQVVAPGLRADHVRGALTIDGELLRDVSLVAVEGEARLTVAGSLALGDSIATMPDGLEITMEDWPVEEVRAWAPVELPLAGPTDAVVRLSGLPEALTGELRATVEPVEVAAIAAERLELALAWDSERLTIERADLVAAAGMLSGEGSLRFADGALDIDLRSVGAEDSGGFDLALSPFLELADERLAGQLQFDAHFGGTTAAPEATLRAEIAKLAAVGRELSPGETTTIAGSLKGGTLDLAVEVPELVTVQGGGPWRPGEEAHLEFAVSSERLDHWLRLALGMPIESFVGTVAAELVVSQEAGGPWSAEVVVSQLALAHRAHTASLLEPALLSLEGTTLKVSSLFLGSSAGKDELFVGGSVDFGAPEPALALQLQATMSVDWLDVFVALDLDGEIEILSEIGGTFARPALNGQAALHGGRWIPPGFPHSIEQLEALALLYPEAVVLDSAHADFAGGRIAAFGRIELPAAGRPLDYRVQATLGEATLRYPEGFLLRGGGEITLQSVVDGRQLRGTIGLARVDYVQDINLSPTQIVQRFLTRTRLQVEETDDFLATTYLNVAVDASDAIRVRNNLARLNGGGELSVRGTLANPVLFGELSFEPGGSIEYAGNDYQLERGVLTFADSARIVPVIDVEVTTRIDDYDVRLHLGGALDRLATSFSSNPPLPDYDVVALLATGAPSGDDTFSGSGGQSGAGALAAESLLYGQAANLIGSRVGTLFGIDRVKIDPLTTGENVSSARVSVGKRLSRRIFVTYSVDPSSTAQQILEVEWKVNDDVTLVMTQNGDGSYALDARWGRRF